MQQKKNPKDLTVCYNTPSSCMVTVKKNKARVGFAPKWVSVSDMRFIWSLCRSVVVAPKKSGLAPSISASAAFPAATAASVSSGTPMDSVAVVSAADASQSTSAEAAAGEDTRCSVEL